MAELAKLAAKLAHRRLAHLGRLVLLHTAIEVRDRPNIPNREQLFISLANSLTDEVAQDLVANLDPYGWGDFARHERAANTFGLRVGDMLQTVGKSTRVHLELSEEAIPW